MRLFIALDLPEEVRAELVGVQAALRSHPVRWTQGPGMHLTLQFLGEMPFDFPSVWWQTNTDCPDQVAACEALGLTREVAIPTERTTWLLRRAP